MTKESRAIRSRMDTLYRFGLGALGAALSVFVAAGSFARQDYVFGSLFLLAGVAFLVLVVTTASRVRSPRPMGRGLVRFLGYAATVAVTAIALASLTLIVADLAEPHAVGYELSRLSAFAGALLQHLAVGVVAGVVSWFAVRRQEVHTQPRPWLAATVGPGVVMLLSMPLIVVLTIRTGWLVPVVLIGGVVLGAVGFSVSSYVTRSEAASAESR